MPSIAVGFDLVCSIRYELFPIEQASNLINKVVSYTHKHSCHYCTSGNLLPSRKVNIGTLKVQLWESSQQPALSRRCKASHLREREQS